MRQKRREEELVGEALLLLPYLLEKGEASLEEVAKDLRINRERVRQIVELLQFCGVPPYGGGDTFDCYVERGTISISMPPSAPERPARLTAQEGATLAFGLQMAGRVMPSLKEGASEVAGKLGRALAEPSGEREIGSLVWTQEDQGRTEEHLGILREAIRRRKLVRMVYYSVNSDQVSQRDVEAGEIKYSSGNWYLSAYCRRRGQTVVFRVDRIRDATLLEEVFGVRRRTTRETLPDYLPSDKAFVMEVLMPNEEARRLEERGSGFLTGIEYDVKSGSARVKARTESIKWAVSFVLRYAGRAVVERPEKLRREVQRIAGHLLSLYEEEGDED